MEALCNDAAYGLDVHDGSVGGETLAMLATKCRLGALLLASAVLVACVEEPLPRSFVEFMEDSLAREGVLVRCNADREATAFDPECVNARRAAAAIAAQDDVGKRERLEAQSEARLVAARQRADAQLAAERRAVLAADAERTHSYEAQWDEDHAAETTVAPVGPESAYPQDAPQIAPSLDTAAQLDAAPPASPLPALEPVTLPSSVRAPLTTISLPRGAKPIELAPPGPELEEIVLPSRLKTVD